MTTPFAWPENIRTAWLVDFQFADNMTQYITSAPFDIVYNSNTYQRDGLILGIGRLSDNVKASDTTVAIQLSAIDIVFKQQILGANINGRPINVYRTFFNDDYSVLRTELRFTGIINSVTFSDDYSENYGGASFTLTVNCKGIKEILTNRIAGRYTEGGSMQRYFPTDTSFDMVGAERDRLIILGRE